MNYNALVPMVLVFIGCCSTVVFLELIIKEEPAAGTIITCSQFVFMSLHGICFTMKFGQRKNVIPIIDYLTLVVLFFIVNVMNNAVFGFNISMPLHIIFRSGGLIASMVTGMIVLGRRYTIQKYVSVIMITLGTILCTFASSKDIGSSGDDSDADQDFFRWLIGIAILTLALFISARMGVFQECLYTKHGKHPQEALFFIHFLSLPGFLLSATNIWEHIIKFNHSTTLPELAHIPILSSIPRLWLYNLGNVTSQYICISSVFRLTSECTSLTVTLVLTLRKFISLILSIIYFQNPFTLSHWMGAILVFVGTLLFSDIFSQVKNIFIKEKKKIQ